MMHSYDVSIDQIWPQFEKKNNAFKNFNEFARRMHNKVYFTETNPGVFEKKR